LQIKSLEQNVIVARNAMAKLCITMKEVGDTHFGTLDHASHELSKRQKQVEDLVSRIQDFQSQFVSWTQEKRQLEREKSELESQVATIENGLDNKSTRIDEQAKKLKNLMDIITLQDEKLQKKHEFLEKKAVELALNEQNVREEYEKNGELYQLIQEERHAVEALKEQMENTLEQQELKEEEILRNEERLVQLEAKLNHRQEETKIGQQRMRELAVQLKTRSEEVTRQRLQLEERLRKCDEYENQLIAWEKQLDEMSNIFHGKEGNRVHDS
jgi:chromosome segregation ATPase